MDNLKPGHILYIKNFELHNKGGKDKPIWFLYLGCDDIFECPLYLHMHKHTTQIQHYESGGKREHHNIVRILNPPYTFFDAEQCILDFNERPHSVDKNHFKEKYWPQCEIKGEFDEAKIREICKYIKRSPFYNKKQKISIRNSLNKIGITGINL